MVVAALVDFRDMADPRDPFSGARVQGRTLGGGVGYEQKDWGIRIDHLMCSPQAADRLKSISIHRMARAMDKPSDHVPVLATFAD
jgi:hypothetical protein